MFSPRTLIGLSLLIVSLAGCADEAPAAVEGEEFKDLDLKADDDTGVIRGVVVDPAVVPVEGATVVLDDGRTATTTAAGAFGFSDVEPGIHQLVVDKVGFVATQTTVDVRAGIDQPPVVKVLLEHDAAELPYVQAFQFSGYIECSATSPAYRVAVCSIPNIVQPGLTDDNFLALYDIQQDPQWVQAEMVWESTQALGDHMLLVVEVSPARETTVREGNGTSPLVVTGYREDIERAGMDKSGVMEQRVFNFQKPETTPPVPVCGVPDPINGGSYCARGVGVTVSQEFEIFSHVAYRFQPADGWQFTVDGAPQVPPA